MILYLLFVIPLTVLAVMERANEKRLCNINESWTRKVILEIRYRYLSQCHSGRCQVRDLIYLELFYAIPCFIKKTIMLCIMGFEN